MAKCDFCGKEMKGGTDSCKEPPDLSVIPTEVPKEMLRPCHDCGVLPGGTHHPGCDVERCGRCGGQAISCGCTNAGDPDDEDAIDPEKEAEYVAKRVENRWTGVWPGYVECLRLGWFCRDGLVDGEWKCHIPCAPTDEGAHPDLNRWYAEGCPTGLEKA